MATDHVHAATGRLGLQQSGLASSPSLFSFAPLSAPAPRPSRLSLVPPLSPPSSPSGCSPSARPRSLVGRPWPRRWLASPRAALSLGAPSFRRPSSLGFVPLACRLGSEAGAPTAARGAAALLSWPVGFWPTFSGTRTPARLREGVPWVVTGMMSPLWPSVLTSPGLALAGRAGLGRTALARRVSGGSRRRG